MVANNWRKKVDPSIKDHLEFQIKESAKNKEAITTSKNPSNAQLWCALANISKQIFDVNLRLRYLERALRDLAKPKEQPKKSKPKPEPKPKKKKIVKKVIKKKKR